MTAPRVTGVVLAAGRSERLGTPKQLLAYGNTTVLGASVESARTCGFDQVVVVLGGAAAAVLETVPLRDVDVVIVRDVGAGSADSLRAALPRVHPEAAGIVVLLGDQPGVSGSTVERLVTEAASSPIAVCRYTDGIGHPFWLSRNVFDELSRLHGDKGVWKLIESGTVPVQELQVDSAIPLDVDTWDDYRRLLASTNAP